ncbi:hypothetical protein [Roseovarius sp. C03]|uniref:hypothetical protein n=1 Tax=Roseovarius sp. C03 TaxID=3449222 RepID=UPI003EDC0D1E
MDADIPPTFSRRNAEAESGPEQEAEPEQQEEDSPPLPSFLQRRNATPDTPSARATGDDAPATDPEPAGAGPAVPEPIEVDLPDDPDDGIAAEPGVLSMLARVRRPLTPDTIAGLESLLSRLRATTGSAPRE